MRRLRPALPGLSILLAGFLAMSGGYVGVAVLFLFVVVLFDVDFAELRQGFLNYLPVGGLVGLILAIELVFIIYFGHSGRKYTAP